MGGGFDNGDLASDGGVRSRRLVISAGPEDDLRLGALGNNVDASVGRVKGELVTAATP